uniref:BPTI/Kunitz inhibitor domain-containing protein n=1 Tax=Maylandia zebra TaxID=106582 RepID=A0A3P9D783_9CICH
MHYIISFSTDFCLLPPDAEGECNGKYLRYYYDSTDKKCKRFSWTGCLGNGNRFFDYNSCNFTCAVVQASKACLLKRAEGGCNGNCVKYYYDSREEKCKELIWTGCVGNGNRFHDYNSCNSTCSARKACHFKKVEGTCNGKYLRYYYDSVYDKCKRFLWTGCLGNGNRFFDFISCNSTCAGKRRRVLGKVKSPRLMRLFRQRETLKCHRKLQRATFRFYQLGFGQ